jgi:hypothetical protein
LAVVACATVGIALAAFPVGSSVKVATNGPNLNVREAPGRSAAVIASVPDGTTLKVAGGEQEADGLRWTRVTEPGGQTGWAASDFLQLVSTPPTSTPVAATSTPAAVATATRTPGPTRTPTPTGEPVVETPPVTVERDLTVEAKVRQPETADRSQTVNVIVTRSGLPVSEAQVVAVTMDTDPPLVRDFGDTNDDGEVSRTFDIRREKGTVTMVIIAIAPNGQKTHTVISYFKR